MHLQIESTIVKFLGEFVTSHVRSYPSQVFNRFFRQRFRCFVVTGYPSYCRRFVQPIRQEITADTSCIPLDVRCSWDFGELGCCQQMLQNMTDLRHQFYLSISQGISLTIRQEKQWNFLVPFGRGHPHPWKIITKTCHFSVAENWISMQPTVCKLPERFCFS